LELFDHLIGLCKCYSFVSWVNHFYFFGLICFDFADMMRNGREMMFLPYFVKAMNFRSNYLSFKPSFQIKEMKINSEKT
jgi:hypothetical protein